MTERHLVIVTGGRDYGYPRIVHARLNTLYVRYGPFLLFHGACQPRGSDEMTGADRYADDWGHATPGIEVKPYKADWDRYGNRAGPIRNRWMVVEAVRRAPVAYIHGLAFPEPGSRGTVNCINVMKEFGIEPDVWDYARVGREMGL